MPDRDSLQRFLFEAHGVRGEIVHLDAVWSAVQETHEYPTAVSGPLGQALAAAALLSATIKIEGSLILQVQGEGPITVLVAQATHERTLRGLAHWRGEVPESGDLQDLFGEGHLAMTADAAGGERYQGVVALEGRSLAEAIEAYFSRSEQLPTRLWLVADERRAAGLLLQRMPDATSAEDDWDRVLALANTLTDAELLRLPSESLLFRLFHDEKVRVLESERLSFRCGCSRERMADALRTLGRDEVELILAEQGEIHADCDFCNRTYRFDAVDVAAIFADAAMEAPASTQ